MSVATRELIRNRALRIVFFDSLTLGAGVSLDLNGINAGGYNRVRGFYHTPTAAAAAGFPRVRQSADGVTFDIVDVIPQDFSQAAFTYTFDILIIAKFISCEWTSDGAAGASPIRADVRLVPIGS